MATKPNIADSRWAVNGVDADAANVTAPSSGQRDTGYALNQIPPSSVENYLRNRVYRWLQYLSDGQLSGNHSIAGALGVTGLATLASAAVTGAATVGGTLGVTGAMNVGGGVTVGSNQNITLTGTGDLKHGDRVLALSAMSGQSTNNNTWSVPVASFSLTSTTNGTLFVPVPLHVGDRIKSVSYAVAGNNSADVDVAVYSVNASTVFTAIGTQTHTNPTAAITIFSLDVTDTTLSANSHLLLEFSASAAGIQVHGVFVTYDRP
jgi:fibronectin-binding autotransporter adhesin